MKRVAKHIVIVLGVLAAIIVLLIVCLFVWALIDVNKKEIPHVGFIGYYDESTERSYGYAGDERSIDFETFYGMKLKTEGAIVTCKPYSYQDDIAVKEIKLYSITKDWKQHEVKTLPVANIGSSIAIDVSEMYNSQFDAIYTIVADFADISTGATHTVTGYLHVNNNIAKCCRLMDSTQKTIDERNAKWHSIIDPIDPASCLDSSKLCYPIRYGGTLNKNIYNMSYSCVDNFQKLSEQIIQDKDWSDAVKVYAIIKYITDNYAYDEYQVDKLDNRCRGVVANDVNNPKYWTYESHVGMCKDFTNIIVIMCRYQNIPCTSVANRKHVVPIVFINNEWVAIDVNPLLPKCIEEDTDTSKWQYPEEQKWDKEYGFIADYLESVGESIDMIPQETGNE